MAQPGMAREGPSAPRYTDTGAAWTGWVAFAGILMIVLGAFNIIDGLVALFREQVFVVGKDRLLAFDFTTLGWILLILGIIMVLAGFAVLAGRTWGRVVAVVLVVLNAIGQLAFISVAPIWSIMVIAIDVIVIYALVAHGREMAE
jgi:vacuolar-type H+-ATPase subunit I/STV1